MKGASRPGKEAPPGGGEWYPSRMLNHSDPSTPLDRALQLRREGAIWAAAQRRREEAPVNIRRSDAPSHRTRIRTLDDLRAERELAVRQLAERRRLRRGSVRSMEAVIAKLDREIAARIHLARTGEDPR